MNERNEKYADKQVNLTMTHDEIREIMNLIDIQKLQANPVYSRIYDRCHAVKISLEYEG